MLGMPRYHWFMLEDRRWAAGWHCVSERGLAVLRAALDASACHPNWIYAVGGFVAHPKAWDEMLPEWQAAVDQWRIPRFHLSQLPKLVGRQNAKACENYFLDIIRQSELHSIGGAIFTEDWKRPDWGDDTSPRFSTPYEQSLWFALKVLAKHCHEAFPGEQIVVVSDFDGSQGAINRIFQKAKAEWPWLDTLALHDGMKLELQCADLAAGILRRSWVEITTIPSCKVPWGRLPLSKSKKTSSSVWSRRQGALIVRAVNLHDKGED